MLHRDKLFKVVPLLTALLLTLLACRDYIFYDGYIYLAEQFEVYSLDQFWRIVYPIWNEQLQGISIADFPKIYYYAFLVAIGKLSSNSYKVLQLTALALPIFITFVSSFYMNKYMLQKVIKDPHTQEHIILIASLVGAFVFTVNPWFVTNPRNIILRIEYSSMPLIALFFTKLLETKKLKYGLYLAILLSIVSGWRFMAIVLVMLIIIFVLYTIHVLKEDSPIELNSFLLTTILSLIAFTLMSLARIIPGVLYSRYIPPQAVEVFTENMIQREPILHIFTTKIYSWTSSQFNMVYNDNTHFIFILIFIFAATYLMLSSSKSSNFYYLFPPTLFVLSVLLVSREINVDSILVMSPSIGRLFRHASWNIMPGILALSVMASYSAYMIATKYNKKAVVVLPLVIVMLLTAVASWPMFTGDMNGYWRPAKPPSDYLIANQILVNKSNDTNHHVIWLPSIGDARAIWSNQTGPYINSAPTGIFGIRSSSLPSYDINSFYFFKYYNVINVLSPFPGYVGNLSQIYSLLNIHYIIICYDRIWPPIFQDRGLTNQKLRAIANNLANTSWATLIYRGKYLSAFELSNSPREFEVRKNILAINGNLPIIGSIESSFDGEIPAIVFLESPRAKGVNVSLFNNILLRGGLCIQF
ncbi:MAG: Uncharacterized protein XD43_0187 [Thermococcales archaeon 44_46]|nr:MAG: Uncharacterized protein XD43_0187 [Thermococcales archaeon 44_46]HIH71985.1 hypothetical protein [Thermococcaceae archaeon]